MTSQESTVENFDLAQPVEPLIAIVVDQPQVVPQLGAVLPPVVVVGLPRFPLEQGPAPVGVEVLAVAREPPRALLTVVVKAHPQLVHARLSHQVLDRPVMTS